MNKITMQIKILLGAFILSLSVATSYAYERHEEETAPSGDAYFFLQAAYPFTPELMLFMAKVHNAPGVDGYTYVNPLSEKQKEEYANLGAAEYLKKYMPQPPKNYRPDPEALQKEMATAKPYQSKEADGKIAQKYGVKTFPSVLYFSPDGYLYRISLPAFNSSAGEKQFWQAYYKHKDKRQQKKLWKDKQWSQ